jgi:mono/diheme cytochrome c family protein
MKVLRVVGLVVGILLVVAVCVYAWASYAAGKKLSKTYATHTVDFPVPFVVGGQKARNAGSGDRARVDALERGRHLVTARYGCGECHGSNFGGGVMIDNAAIGRVLGPNLTSGKGSVTVGYTPADWDRIVRHGIRLNGTPALMPSQDFQEMTDQELSDIVLFLRSQPPVDNEVAQLKLGPVGKMLIATGKLPLSADLIPRDKPHAVSPPQPKATVEFGRHLAATCTGCHQSDLSGGTIVGGDPSWPPAANLTPGPAGIGDWSLADFTRALREGKRPDGSALRQPMANVATYTRKMTETELEALWSYLRSVPVRKDGKV